MVDASYSLHLHIRLLVHSFVKPVALPVVQSRALEDLPSRTQSTNDNMVAASWSDPPMPASP